MASYSNNTFFGGWQDTVADTIAVETGTKKLSSSKIDELNKRYEEALYYKLSGGLIDQYVSKNAKVSIPVAKVFRENIEAVQAAEKKRILEKEKSKSKPKIFKWYHYALLGGGILMFLSLSPSINAIVKTVALKK